MATFVMFGRYTADAIKGISAKRTEKADSLIKSFGGVIKSSYALLGDRDLMLICEFPGISEAMKASVALTKLTGIGFTSAPALPVDEFDKLMAGV